MLSTIHEKWMNLDPTKQYLYWIMTFAAMLFVCCMGLVISINMDLLTIEALPFIIAGIFGFVTLFSLVVVFLNIIWPHQYEKNKNKNLTKQSK